MTYIHFIINPVSGDGRHNLSDLYIRQFFPADRFKIRADYTCEKARAFPYRKRTGAESRYHSGLRRGRHHQ